MADIDLHSLLGSNPLSTELGNYIAFVVTNASLDQPISPEIKSYSDAVYFNYYKLGLSLQFAPKDGYKPSPGLKQNELKNEKLFLDSIYLYNTSPGSANGVSSFSTHPVSPLVLNLNPNVKGKDGNLLSRPSVLDVQRDTSGKDFVKVLLEPDRKGGGAGPSSGSIGIWCEWSEDGLMVEFGGAEAKGPQAWERGKDALWKIITIFALST